MICGINPTRFDHWPAEKSSQRIGIAIHWLRGLLLEPVVVS